MSKKQKEQFENNNSIEKLNGFVPVQYKILKLDAKYITSSKKIEKPRANSTGTIGYYDVPKIELIDWLIFSHGKNGLVSVGDNILFQKIREVKAANNGNFDMGGLTPNEQQKGACEKLEKFRSEIKQLKRKVTEKATDKRIKDLNDKIMEMEEFLFVPEVINVQSNKTEYDKFGEKGFYYGGEKYIRRSAGAGNLKQNTVTFIREDISKKVLPKLRVGFQLDIETSEILAPSKFGAYEGLTTSGCIFVEKPKVVVIPDFEYITFKDKDNKEHCVYYVTKENRFEEIDGKEVNLSPKYHINTVPFYDTKEEGAYLNSFDGMGMVCPDFVKRKWVRDLNIDYVPSAFIVRSIGVKGLLVTFPFKEFARRKGYTKILDIKYKDCKEDNIVFTDLDDVDVILTESQWKYKKLYTDNSGKVGYNFDYYNGNPEAIWGIQRYTPKEDKDISRLNYQLVHTSNIQKNEDVEKVIEPTKKYLRLLANGKPEHIMYALLKEAKRSKKEHDNNNEDDSEFEDTDFTDEETDDSSTVDYDELKTSTLNRAIYQNRDLFNDVYVSNQMKKMIKGLLNKAKCGKLYPEHNSNYQFMISDPYGLAQWAFNWFDWKLNGTQGRENRVIEHIPTTPKEETLSGIGLIPAKHIYSEYWMKKGVTNVDACRSPMTDIAEHNILTVCNTKNTLSDVFSEMETYYKFIHSGIIYSLHDLSMLIHSDSDWDGDIVCTFDSEVFIDNAWDVMPTTYDKAADKLNRKNNEEIEEKPEKKYTIANAVKSDKQGFGNKVGVYSNFSTSLFAMMPLFKDGEKHNDKMFPEYDCTEKQLALHKIEKTDRFIIGEEIDSTKTGKKPDKSEDFIFTNASKDEIRRYNQSEIEGYAEKFLKQNELVPKYMPYFFIYAKDSYKDKYTKYKMRMNDICKWYTYESIDNFVGAVMRGERELQTDNEKEFWKFFFENCPLLLTDCLMNRVCWKLEAFEKELDSIIKEKWKNSEEKYVLMSYAKTVELNKSQIKFIKSKYEEYFAELKAMYNKKNVRETNDLFQVSRREALIFRLRRELCTELKVGFEDLFDILVTALKTYGKAKYNSINAFIWNIMDDDILDVIPINEEYLDWDDELQDSDEYDAEILGRKVSFTWRKRTIDK